jgi:hypothetical protein
MDLVLVDESDVAGTEINVFCAGVQEPSSLEHEKEVFRARVIVRSRRVSWVIDDPVGAEIRGAECLLGYQVETVTGITGRGQARQILVAD